MNLAALFLTRRDLGELAMKYVIWVAVFLSYLLVFMGIFRLMASATAGLEVEMTVEREVYGEIKLRTQMVEFNEIPAVKWGFGLAGLLIAVGGGFICADYMGRAWDGEEENKRTKAERLIWIGTFIVLFFAFLFLFQIRSINDLFKVFTDQRQFRPMGILFMAATCIGTYLVAAALSKLAAGKNKAADAADGEVA